MVKEAIGKVEVANADTSDEIVDTGSVRVVLASMVDAS